jgi:tetrahydromethanopterin S-methyltransferase subunit D
MKRIDWIGLGPSFVLACGIVAAMWVATSAGGRAVRTAGGAAVLALAVVAAEVWSRRQRGRTPRPSWAAMILVAGLAGASAILMDGDAGFMRTLIPVFGVGCWVTLLMRPEAKGLCCESTTASAGRR